MATSYFRAVKQIGVGGTLHLAHVVKAAGTEEGKKRFRGLKPFGSAFWSNSARSNWFVRRADDEDDDPDEPIVGLYQQKVNRRRSPDVGFQFCFGSAGVVCRTDLSDCPTLAIGLSLSRRAYGVLRRGPQTISDLAAVLNAKRNSVEKALRRSKAFTVLTNTPDGVHRWALAEAGRLQ
jgi:hypothetical protein